jgi:hypothetical protein
MSRANQEGQMITVGIDPGLKGAAAALFEADAEGEEFMIDAIHLPVMEDGSKNQIDDDAFRKWLIHIQPWRVVIENVQPMPSIPGKNKARRSMGAASSFRFGMAVGQLRATVRALGIEPKLVHPQVWKRAYSLAGPDKEPSRQLALQLWPDSAYLLRRKLDQQRAEAMLIAKWGSDAYGTAVPSLSGYRGRRAVELQGQDRGGRG